MMQFLRRKIASFCKNPKITFLGSKKKSKNRKKFFFFRIVQNYPKVTKKVKNSKFWAILLRLELIFGHFLRCPKSPNWPKNRPKMAKSGIQLFCAGPTAHTKNRKFFKMPKIASLDTEIVRKPIRKVFS